MSVKENIIKQIARIGKYRNYISDAETLEEARSMAPDDYSDQIQQGDNGGFYYQKTPDSGGGLTEETNTGFGDSVDIDTINPELAPGPGEEVVEYTLMRASAVDRGEVLQYNNPDGEGKKFGVVEHISGSGVDSAFEFVNGDYVDSVFVTGKIVDRAAPWQVDTDFGRSMAFAVEKEYFGNTHYDDNYVQVRNLQQNVSSVDDVELLKRSLKQEIDGRNSRSARDALAGRIRAVGGDPSDILPGPDDEVPEIRQGTQFEAFSTNKARKATRNNIFKKGDNYEEWNEFYDHLTQDELEDFLISAVEDGMFKENVRNASPLTFEDGFEEAFPGYGDPPDPNDLDENYYENSFMIGNSSFEDALGQLTSRMDVDTLDSVYDYFTTKDSGLRPADIPASKEADMKDIVQNVRTAILKYGKDGEKREELIRKEFENDYVVGVPGYNGRFHDEIRSQVGDPKNRLDREDDFDAFMTSMTSEWSGANEKHIRSVLKGMFRNDGSTTVYVDSRAIGSIEPTPTQRNHLERLYNETRSYYKRNFDDPVTVYRGVASKVTSHGPADSWSRDRNAAENFVDGYSGVLFEAELEPGDILMSKEASKALNHEGFPGFESEEEVVVLGGGFTEGVSQESFRPD